MELSEGGGPRGGGGLGASFPNPSTGLSAAGEEEREDWPFGGGLEACVGEEGTGTSTADGEGPRGGGPRGGGGVLGMGEEEEGGGVAERGGGPRGGGACMGVQRREECV